MDYGSVLQLAKKNADQKKEVKRAALPKLPPARTAEELRRQESEKKRLLDANVARFLAKKKEDELKKLKEANKKRGELLSIRNQDAKARKRVKIMNKSAKSADKSAIEDAVGPSDYYVIEEPTCFMSQECLAQEEKFLENLCKGSAGDKFTKGKANTNRDLNSTKARVQLALQLGDTVVKDKSHESRNKSNEKKKDKRKDHHSEDEVIYKEVEKPRIRKQAPPPMNYHELLLLAEKLQQEPIREPTPEKDISSRPMTAKQREVFLCEEASRKRKEAGWKEEARLKKMGKSTPDRVDTSHKKIGAPTVSSAVSNLREEKSTFSIPRIPKLNGTATTSDKKIISSSSNVVRQSGLEDATRSTKQGSRPTDRPHPSKQTDSRDSKRSVESQSCKQSVNNAKNTSIATTLQSNNKCRISESSNMSGLKPSVKYSSTKTSTRENSDSLRSSKEPKSKFTPPTSDIKSKKDDRKSQPSSSINSKIGQHALSEMKASLASQKAKSIQSPDSEARSKQRPISVSGSSIGAKSRSKSLPGTSTQIQSGESRARRPLPTENKPRQVPSANIKTSLVSSDAKSRQVLSSNAKFRQLPPTGVKSHQVPLASGAKPRLQLSADVKSRQIPSSDVKSRPVPSTSDNSRQFPPSGVKPRQFPPSDIKPRQFPPADIKPRQFPPADVRSRNFPPADVRQRPRPKAAPKRRIIESDDEYDSEDADFIEDDPEDCNEDYSKYIKEIFGYDKSRYRGIDEDDRNMESSFQQQLKEEFTSAKLGLLEDLEDIQKEKKQLKQAMLKKRKLK